MTTKITIKHEGPAHKNVKVTRHNNGALDTDVVVLKEGQSCEHHVYDGVRIDVEETSDPPTANA